MFISREIEEMEMERLEKLHQRLDQLIHKATAGEVRWHELHSPRDLFVGWEYWPY